VQYRNHHDHPRSGGGGWLLR
ncbi:ABC transporter family protein, partial [Vibrio cholerae CP1035(8)]